MQDNATSRTLLPAPLDDPENWSVRRLRRIIQAFPEMESYLEVGVEFGLTFEKVPMRLRVGVDPRPRFNLEELPTGMTLYVQTSDTFFEDLDPVEQFDVIFLDGLHTYQQTYCDVINALQHCPRGIILADDIIPCDEVSAIPDLEESIGERRRRGLPGLLWHGDVFRMMLCIADHHPELNYLSITDPDNPQALIWKKRVDDRIRPVSAEVLATYASREFLDVFENGVPSFFHPVSEDEGLTVAIDSLRTLRQQPRPLPVRISSRLRRTVRRVGWKWARRDRLR
ncbi:MAG: class I SAM-dependent methyltransferase [Ilumatobacteraceae bacterium]